MSRFAVLVLAAIVAAGRTAAQPQTAQQHFDRGRALYEEHDDTGEAMREAEVEFRRALTLDPRFAPAVAYLGFIAAEQDHLDEAEAAYRTALQYDPISAEAHVGLAQLALRRSRRDEAVRLLRLAVKDRPKNKLALGGLASALAHEPAEPTPENWREAIDCWQALVKLDRDDRDAHHDLARAYEHLGKWPEAESHYREVLRIGQTDQDSDVWVYSVHRNVAEMLEKQGKYPAAIREYEALINALNELGAGDGEIEDVKRQIEALRKKP